ncbi:MAG: VOC family protein [Sphingobium sp.]
MSRIFGPVYQNGYIVRDLDEAIDHWVRMGVGPFYRIPVAFDHYVHRGVASSPDLEVALGNSGDLQIELIVQRNDAPSAYTEFLARHTPGLQHLSVWTETFDADVARWEAAGFPLVTDAKITGAGRVVFYDTDAPGCIGGQMEVLERTDKAKYVMETVRDAAKGWDGRDPVRRFSEG